MLLGKRPRPSMRRTTSMTEFSLDLQHIEPPPQTPTTIRPLPAGAAPEEEQHHHNLSRRNTVSGGDTNNTLLSMASTTTHRRNSHGFLETPHFLRTCELCKRSLRPGRDIFMYRGDTAFCSSECRQQQMNHDERKEKCSIASKKEIQPSTIMMTPGSEASTNGETIAAA